MSFCEIGLGRACSDPAGNNPYCQQWAFGNSGCSWQTPAVCSAVKLDALATTQVGSSCCTEGANGLCQGTFGRACSDPAGNNPYCQHWVCGNSGCSWVTK